MESLDDLIDESRAGVRIRFGMDRAELEARAIVRATAATWLSVYDILCEAQRFPEVFVPDPLAGNPDAPEFARRAAVLDLAVRLSVAENTIRAQEHAVATLLARAPRVWQLFREGDISVANVRVVVDLVATLPEQTWDSFETAAVSSALLAPARFKTRMRAARERAMPDAAERHRAALDERRVWLERDFDGMSEMGIRGAAAACERAVANVDRLARGLQADPGETRTLAQLRADVALDLLGGKLGSHGRPLGGGVGISVRVTIPVMTMLGHSDEPALLEGYGPIDADTARELTQGNPELTRILTHPVTGSIIDVDNPRYKPTTRQQRAVEARDEQCTAIGCGKPADRCDLDHTVPWPAGATSYSNLKPLCREHHRVKHKTRWKSEQDADGNTTWTSPTGFTRPADPPPF